jgi:hypothetical protein
MILEAGRRVELDLLKVEGLSTKVTARGLGGAAAELKECEFVIIGGKGSAGSLEPVGIG